jgi:hypothetical protein
MEASPSVEFTSLWLMSFFFPRGFRTVAWWVSPSRSLTLCSRLKRWSSSTWPAIWRMEAASWYRYSCSIRRLTYLRCFAEQITEQTESKKKGRPVLFADCYKMRRIILLLSLERRTGSVADTMPAK